MLMALSHPKHLNIIRTQIMPDISDEELQKLEQVAGQRRGGKPIKYLELAAHRDSIVKAMQRDIPLPVLLDWLRTNRGVSVVLNTLRKYVVKRIGRDAYDEYLRRNGWNKPLRTPRKGTQTAAAENAAVGSQVSKEGPRFDLNLTRPATFNRTKRD